MSTYFPPGLLLKSVSVECIVTDDTDIPHMNSNQRRITKHMGQKRPKILSLTARPSGEKKVVLRPVEGIAGTMMEKMERAHRR